MPIFRYTVANQEGKKLSGTVEAPDQNTARSELNNLGFSILTLEETQEQPKVDSNLAKFVFEALDKNSKPIHGTVPAENQDEAYKKLQEQYNVNVTALWAEGATEEEIQQARAAGSAKMREQIPSAVPENTQTFSNPEEEKKVRETKMRINEILQSVPVILQKFEQQIDPQQKSEIDKKINKLLRIKNSTNMDYILATAEELLLFIQSIDQNLQKNGLEDQRLELKMRTKELLDQLHSTQRSKTLSEDVIEKIDTIQKKQSSQVLNSTLEKIKGFFQTPEEIQVIKNQIKTYNHQIWEFILLYFKEPTPDYRAKVKTGIKTVWAARKKAKDSLKTVMHQRTERAKATKFKTEIGDSILEELNSLSGWLLFFYTAYYIIALYLYNKDFGLPVVPEGFDIYNSHIFKYLLVILFLIHASTATKINIFRKSIAANIIIPICFLTLSIIVIFNF